jgi:hypothetical protein
MSHSIRMKVSGTRRIGARSLTAQAAGGVQRRAGSVRLAAGPPRTVNDMRSAAEPCGSGESSPIMPTCPTASAGKATLRSVNAVPAALTDASSSTSAR